jgi:NADPH:quinone reductase-like Zn-dependent oxidoreductase
MHGAPSIGCLYDPSAFNGRQLAEFGRLLDGGTVRVAINSTFPLSCARKANERAARGHVQGKIVLDVE